MLRPMRNLLLLSIFLAIAVFPIHSAAQKVGIRVRPRIPASSQPRETGVTAVVMDETLAVLRVKPSLFADAVQRMRRGRKVLILGEAEADGVKFFKVSAPPSNTGWVQTEAVFGKFRPGDE